MDDNDVLRALDSLIEMTGDAHARMIVEGQRTKSARAWAFECHNVANAVAYRQVVRGRIAEALRVLG